VTVVNGGGGTGSIAIYAVNDTLEVVLAVN